MRGLSCLFENNRNWAQKIQAENPEFFERLSKKQVPEYLWIGCSDSRVPATDITGLTAGDIFVHRNIANQVLPNDASCLSVIQYAVDVLQVKHIIVCGHYGCGGVAGAMDAALTDPINDWLQHVRDIYQKYADTLDEIEDKQARTEKLCELNVIEQVANVCQTPTVKEAWVRGQELAVHGWIYALKDGLLNDLHICVRKEDDLADIYRVAINEEPAESE